MAKSTMEMDAYFQSIGFARHKQGYKGKGFYFSVGGYDITKADAEVMFRRHKQTIKDSKLELFILLRQLRPEYNPATGMYLSYKAPRGYVDDLKRMYDREIKDLIGE